MRRRALLFTLAAGTTTFGGCSLRMPPAQTDAPTLSIRTRRSSVQASESSVLELEASGVGWVQFEDLPTATGDDRPLTFDFEGATFDPLPDPGADSFPPEWEWQRPSRVTGAVPFDVSGDAEPGTYQVAVSARTTRSGSGVTETTEIAVEN